MADETVLLDDKFAHLERGDGGGGGGDGGVRGGSGGWRFDAELVHDPGSLLALGGPALVEYECLPHADHRPAPRHRPVLPRGLPVARQRRTIRPQPRRVLSVPQAVEVPLLPPHTCSF